MFFLSLIFNLQFLSHDVPLFDSIISDLFPGVVLPAPDHGSLEVSIREITRKMNLQPVPCFIKKIIQVSKYSSYLYVIAFSVEYIISDCLLSEFSISHPLLHYKALDAWYSHFTYANTSSCGKLLLVSQ